MCLLSIHCIVLQTLYSFMSLKSHTHDWNLWNKFAFSLPHRTGNTWFCLKWHIVKILRMQSLKVIQFSTYARKKLSCMNTVMREQFGSNLNELSPFFTSYSVNDSDRNSKPFCDFFYTCPLSFCTAVPSTIIAFLLFKGKPVNHNLQMF